MQVEARKLVSEAIGTFFLVFFAVGVATLSFGPGFAFSGSSKAAGVVATALAFGLVLLGLAYTLGPLSGCHVNPAVTIGFLLSRRVALRDAIGYWVAQFVGGILGALVLWGVVSGSPAYSRKTTGLGADGFGKLSMVHLNAGAAFGTEVILTFLFVFVILSVTRRIDAPGFAGLVIGLTLTIVHLIGIPLTGTSVNPARSLGPALVVGGQALSQVWLFIVAPLVGGAVAALIYTVMIAEEPAGAPPESTIAPEVSGTA